MDNWIVWDSALKAEYSDLKPVVRAAVAHAIAATPSWYLLKDSINWVRIHNLIQVYSAD
jgi:hypothetical protein